MLTEDYVSFETAKLLKEKGFEGKMHTFYTEKGTEMESAYVVPSNFFPIYRPTLQMAVKWLWKEHKLHVEPSMTIDGFTFLNKWHCFVMRVDNKNQTDLKCIGEDFDSYEEACEAGIRYCLENLI